MIREIREAVRQWAQTPVVTAVVVALASPAFDAVALGLIFWLPLNATAMENFAVFGTDNIFIPGLVVMVLNSLQSMG